MELDTSRPKEDRAQEGARDDIKTLLALRDRIGELTEIVDGTRPVQPNVDLLDLGDAFELIAELPGVPQSNLEIAVHDRDVTIAGLRDPYDGEHHVLQSERPRGRFQRTVTLPRDIDRERATAHLREGLLVLHLPKS